MKLSELIELAEQEVAAIKHVLPDDVKAHAQQCPVHFEAAPAFGDEDMLGVFEGASLIDEAGPDSLPSIRIFVDRIWEYVETDEQDFLDEVGTTYLHELGHYLGWDEEEVAQRGLE
jgi:predicted Zn-dependent protease with MMP-like domain